MTYFESIQYSMKYIARNKNVLFLGQSVSVPGNLIFKSLSKVKEKQKIELPVFEETQMGMAIGLSLNGFIPVSCYPRFDFFLLALNQFVNHLDKFEEISSKEFNPFVLTRVLVGSKKPIDAGPQHTQNYSKAINYMVKNIKVVDLKNKKIIFNSFKKAFDERKSTLFIEYSDQY